MVPDIDELLVEARAMISSCSSLEELQRVDITLFGRKGSITSALKSIGLAAPANRKALGALINKAKEELAALIDEKKRAVVALLREGTAAFDVTLPGAICEGRGTLHPITQMMYELNDAFYSLGFEIYEGPEISSEAYCFDSLNFPADHPARESMDTFWLEGYENNKGGQRISLRPHLTGASVRYMQTHKPPMRFVYPGRVYRNESTDASHERAFFQYEALIIDREVPFTSGRLLIDTILEKVFGRRVNTRMRAGFFPFVEPGFEIDMQCLVCQGAGCSVCKHVGWLEMMPGGPPHPNVMKAGGINPHEWQGFYINIGLDRLTMMRHNIDDIRLFSSADLRFLRQFP